MNHQAHFGAELAIAVAGVASSYDGRREQHAVQDDLRHHVNGASGVAAKRRKIKNGKW